jgi:acid phosphatase type 7
MSLARRYTQDLGAWRVHNLDSNGSSQINQSNSFLDNALPSPDFDIVIWHHARYSPGSDHGSNTSVDSLWETAKQGPSLVLYSHDHLYADGLTENQKWFLTGTGGAQMLDDFCSGTAPPGLDDCIAQQIGVQFLTLYSDGRWESQLVAANGDVLDSDSGTLAASPP